MKAFSVGLLAASLACLVAPAAPAAALQAGAGPGVRPLPEQHTQNGVKYMCGGIGMVEAARMRQIASDYDLMLTFAAADGAYLADIDVEIAPNKGKTLLAVRCSGPIMLVDLPQVGRYRIAAETEGRRVVRTTQVRNGQTGKRVSVTWPVQAGERSSTGLP